MGQCDSWRVAETIHFALVRFCRRCAIVTVDASLEMEVWKAR